MVCYLHQTGEFSGYSMTCGLTGPQHSPSPSPGEGAPHCHSTEILCFYICFIFLVTMVTNSENLVNAPASSEMRGNQVQWLETAFTWSYDPWQGIHHGGSAWWIKLPQRGSRQREGVGPNAPLKVTPPMVYFLPGITSFCLKPA